MKNKIKWIIIAVALVGVIAGAAVLYHVLSRDYAGNNLMQNSQTQNQASEDNEYAAPDFTVLGVDGSEVKLSDYRGKPVVLNFWATWCYYCKVEMPDFDKAYEKISRCAVSHGERHRRRSGDNNVCKRIY